MNDNQLNLLTFLAQRGDENAMLEWADYYYFKANKQELSEKTFQTVMDYYYLLADKGNDHAMTALGSMFYEGVNIPQDFKQAKIWYERAAKYNNSLAINYLGYCHYYGRDIPVDFERAFHCFARAAQMGHHNGMYKLGDMYYNGHFVPKDPGMAFYWYHQAEKIIDALSPEYPNIAFRIGHCYLSGAGIPRDLLLSLEWLQQAELGCYQLIKKGDAYGALTLVRVQEDLEALRHQLDTEKNYRHADLGDHNPLNM